jgi:hypothetical protein
VLELNNILGEAAQSIEAKYFLLPIADTDPVPRERVYCYELYHQMRHRWPTDTRHSLNGEIDKVGHPNANAPLKPDFIVHQPGSMDFNYAIIEVKPVQAKPGRIRKDLNTLSEFKADWFYARAILLIYGGSRQEILAKVGDTREDGPGRVEIEVWHHPEPGQAAAPAGTIFHTRTN